MFSTTCFNERKFQYRLELKCVALVWAVLVVVFLPYWSSFFLGNHDFRFVRYGIPVDAGFFEGRFTQFVVPWLFSDGQILPAWNVFLGFAFLAGAAVKTASWFGLPKKGHVILTFALVIVLNPYMLSQLYYVHQILSICCWFLLCVIGVIGIDDGIQNKSYLKVWGGCIALFVSFGGYIASLELVFVLCIGKFWLDFLEKDKIDRAFFIHYLKMMGAIVFVLMLYVAVVQIMKQRGLIVLGMYNVSHLSVWKIVNRFLMQWYMPWKVLWQSFPYDLPLFGCAFVLISIVALGVAWFKKKLLWSVICFIALVYGGFCIPFISVKDFFDTFRIHLYSVPFLMGVLFAVSFIYGKLLYRNLSMALVAVLICCFIKIDCFAQKVWLLGNKQDDFYAERIKKDLLPKLQKNKKYRLTTLGGMYGREKFAGYADNYSLRTFEHNRELFSGSMYVSVWFSSGFFWAEPVNPIWGDAMYMSKKIFYGVSSVLGIPKDKLIDASIFSYNAGHDKQEQLAALREMKPFPDKHYFFIGEKDIFLMMPKVLDAKYLLEKHILTQ